MELIDIVHRAAEPVPWTEGEKIPWHDPEFSARMLREHLSQEHDGASRRSDAIAAHIRWIHKHLLSGAPVRILDLACGPGLYTSRLAALGHDCTGIDFAPASIDYARATAEAEHLTCDYHLADIRTAEYGHDFALVMLIHGEFNVFRPAEARAIVAKARRALTSSGLLLLEVHTDAAIRRMGAIERRWESADAGLFSTSPHLRLNESTWDDQRRVATHRYLVIDAQTSAVAWYAESVQAYTDEEYQQVLKDCGFLVRDHVPSLDGSAGSDDYVVFVGVAV